MRLLKETLVVLALGAAIVVAVVVVMQRQPWVSEREREQDWIRGYVTWRNAVANGAAAGTPGRQCAPWLDDVAGSAPTERTRTARRAAVDACVELLASVEADELTGALEQWEYRQHRIAGDLWDGLAASASPEPASRLAAPVVSIAGARRPQVLCWPEDGWRALQEEYQLLARDEFWVAGYADVERSQIHLDPAVCAPLRRFFTTSYAPFGNDASFELAEALVVLAHEAEHLRSPDASEAEVECVALQRVRGLVTAAGRSAVYAEEMAGLAWDAGYPLQFEDYRTEQCGDGGPLDLHPDTDVWP